MHQRSNKANNNSKNFIVSVHHLVDIMHALIREVNLSEDNSIIIRNEPKICSISHTKIQFKNVRINIHHLVEIMHALINNMTPSDDISKTIIKRPEPKNSSISDQKSGIRL